MFKSLQWKIVLIFFLLTLIAMEFMGIFLLRNLKDYYLDNFDNMLNTQAGLLSWSVEPYLSAEGDEEHFAELIRNFAGQTEGIKTVAVLDTSGNMISGVDTEGNWMENLSAYSFYPEVISALSGTIGMGSFEHPATGEMMKRFAYPVKNSGTELMGVIYLEASLKSTYEILNNIRRIVLNATIGAIVLTVLLAFVMARTITKPIRQVTAKTAELAKGEFGQPIEVKSNDEIGQLTNTFNYLSRRLKSTLTEIGNEKSKMEAIFNYMTDGVLAFNLNGELILYNTAADGMLQIPKENFVNIRQHGLTFNEELQNAVVEALNSQTKLPNNNEMIISTASKQYLRVNFAPFRNENKEITGLVIVLNDVTEQEKLQTMQQEFVANVSHELRTPLTVVRSYVETLLEGALDDRGLSERFLNVIHSEAVRMTNLVKDLLELSQFDYQETKWKKTAFELNAIMPLIYDKMVVNTKSKGQELSFSLTEEPLNLFADKERIEQVIMNIISNAVKYTDEGGHISVSTHKEGDLAVVKVKDDGMGIPKEDLPRLFERFYRVDKARSRELGGTGLGLSIAEQIVHAHKGSIEIYSDGPQMGTEVTITIPTEIRV